MIAFRDGTPDDASALADLFARSFTSTFGHLYPAGDLADFLSGMTADRFREQLSDPTFRFRIASDGPELAGYIKLGPPELPVETPPQTIELCQLYVLEQWHGQGIASALMDWALATATAQGARQIQLSVFIDNHRARRFYERYGFVAVGRYDFMVGSHADEDLILRHIVMESPR